MRRFLLPWLCWVVAAGLLASTFWPAPRDATTFELAIPTSAGVLTRTAVIEAPHTLREGQAAMLRLRLLPQGAEPAGATAALEALLEIPGVPENGRQVREALLGGANTTFSWQISLPRAGDFSARLWLRAEVESEQQALLAAPVALRATRPLGLTPGWVRGLAAGLALVGLLGGGLAFRCSRRAVHSPEP
jgi:hypothetical protein